MKQTINNISSYQRPAWSLFLVGAQFSLIATLLWSLPLQPDLVSLPVQLIAAFIGLWTLKTMQLGDFNIVPDPKPDTQLVTYGPYRWVRHPMYLSILLFFLPMVLANLNVINVALYLSLLITLFVKLNYEERLLLNELPEYQDYRTATKKLIPFII